VERSQGILVQGIFSLVAFGANPITARSATGYAVKRVSSGVHGYSQRRPRGLRVGALNEDQMTNRIFKTACKTFQ
jgi:hypothetical protein